MFKLNPLVGAISLALLYPAVSLASDTGDAPASYGLATHEVVAGAPFLGELVPDDNAPVNSALANGDDTDVAGDDEDGVFGHPTLVEFGKSYTTNVFVTNPTGAPAYLAAWVDFNGDGVFAANEASTTFEIGENAVSTVPAGATNIKAKMLWPDTLGLTTDYIGTTYIRVRISSSVITAEDALGGFNDGEVEDYSFPIEQDSDGDEIPNSEDLDNDNDGIPDTVEGLTLDTDSDGFLNYLDVDSDADGIPDYAEAGPDANSPKNTDGDSLPDYLDTDSNNDGTPDSAGIAGDSDGDGITDALEGAGDSDGDGILNINDIDSDNDLIPDSVEIGISAPTPVDTDGDLIPDFLDLDSDNDGIPDIYESNVLKVDVAKIDVDNDGRADNTQLFGSNGYVNFVARGDNPDIPQYAIPDVDGDGVRDFRDTDSDNDGVTDVVEAGGVDADNDGVIDAFVDSDGDGIPDLYDFNQSGGVDTDDDQIDDIADTSFTAGVDADLDGVLDSFDVDDNGDGIVDVLISEQQNSLFANGSLPDLDDNKVPDFQEDALQGGTTGGGTTGGTTTTGDTTTGETTTAGGSNLGIVETGLSGTGCSLTQAKDPFFPGLVFVSAVVMFVRRKLSTVKK